MSVETLKTSAALRNLQSRNLSTDERPKSLAHVPWPFGGSVGCISCHLTPVFLLPFTWDTSLPPRDSKCLYSGPDLPEQELCLSCLNELQNGNSPEPSLSLGQRVLSRNEDPAKGLCLFLVFAHELAHTVFLK